ncbi:MAG TPA: LuxR C-terminal-related transcriptional regulator [Mycobacteriales bacterium]
MAPKEPKTLEETRPRPPLGAAGHLTRDPGDDRNPLGRLSAGALLLVEVAAMFDGTFSVDDLAAVLDEPVGPLLAGAEEVLSAGTVVPRGEALAFRDERTRAEVYARIPDPLRGTLHRSIGAVLLARGGCDEAAAAHLIKGVRPGERAVLAELDAVSGQLTARSPEAAAELAQHALELTEDTDELRLPRAVAAVEALLAARRFGEAVLLARKMLDPARASGGPAAQLRLTLCTVQAMSGDPRAAAAEAAALLAERHLSVRQREGATLVRSLGLLAAGDLAAGEAAAEAMLAGEDRPGRDAVLSAGLSALAWVAWHRGHLTTALGLVRAAAGSAHGSAPGPRAELWLAAMLAAVGEFDEAAEVVDRAAGAIERPLHALWEPYVQLLRARLAVAAGDLDEAVRRARLALSLAAELGSGHAVPGALATLSQVAVLRGDLREAAGLADRIEPGPVLLPTDADVFTWTAARLAAARDGAAAALAAVAGPRRPLPAEPVLLVRESAAADLTRVALDAGDRGLARAVVTRAEQLAASNTGLRSLRAAAAHARGLLDRDAPLLDQAAGDYRGPWSAASAREDAGETRGRAGDKKAARDDFESALDGYLSSGAERDAGRLRSRLRELGVRPRHWARAERPASGWESLTESERRVADTVAEGLTNRQSAERLFLSPHTVDFHLRQIFLKLGIRSRVELTRLVLQHEDQPAAAWARTT